MTPYEMEPATFRLVAQCLGQLRHRVPHTQRGGFLKDDEARSKFSQFFESVYKMPCRHVVKLCEVLR